MIGSIIGRRAEGRVMSLPSRGVKFKAAELITNSTFCRNTLQPDAFSLHSAGEKSKHHPHSQFFRTLAIMEDSEDAIQNARLALLTDSPDRALLLADLGQLLHDRYCESSAVPDLEEAIQVTSESIDMTPDDDEQKPERLFDLVSLYGRKYQVSNEIRDLENQIRVGRLMIDATQPSDPLRPRRMALVGYAFAMLYDRRGNMEHLEEAIQITTDAADVVPADEPDRAYVLKCLSDHLAAKFLATDESDDTYLEQAIEMATEATRITSDHWQGECLSSLSMHLSTRYTSMGDLQDLVEAISLARQCVDLAVGTKEDTLGYSVNLGGLLGELHSRTRDMEPLEESIRLSKQMMAQIAKHSPMKASIFQNYCSQLDNRYARLGAIEDLVEAIRAGKVALGATEEGDSERPNVMNTFAVSQAHFYDRTGTMSSLEEAIKLWRESAQLTEDGIERAGVFNNLALYLGKRFDGTGDVSNLEEGIRFARRCVADTPEDHHTYAERLQALSVVLDLMFTRTGEMKYLKESAQVAEEAVQAALEDDPNLPMYLDGLGNRLGHLFQTFGQTEDLERAIASSRRAVELTPPGHEDLPRVLSNLSYILGDKYFESGSATYAEEAVEAATQCLDLTPSDHAVRPDYLNTLAEALLVHYKATGDAPSLDKGIQAAREGLDGLPEGHESIPFLLKAQGLLLSQRFSKTGEMKDLEDGIEAMEHCVRITPPEHSGLGARLQNLGNILSDRFLATGALVDLERAIEVIRQAVAVTPATFQGYPAVLNNLGSVLGDRFWRTGALSDLTEAIELVQKAIEMSQDDDKQQAMYLNTLGVRLGDLYFRTDSVADLESAIGACEKAVELTPKEDGYHGGRLNSLAIQLGTRHARTQVTADLKKAIRVAREAVNATPNDHPDCPMFLNTLGFQLNDLFLATKALPDLQDAISVTQMAVEACPKEHPDRAMYLNNLGTRLNDRFLLTKRPSDLAAAISYLKMALNLAGSRSITRIEGAISLIEICAANARWEQAFEAAELAIKLIPTMSPRSLEQSDKQHALTQVVGLASISAAVALQAGKGPMAALGFLEQGRGVLAASLEEMRTDVLDLRDKYPELAEQFVSLRDELHTPRRNGSAKKEDLWIRSERRYAVDSELDALISAIRGKPGFESFLTVPGEASLLEAASSGPIVVINTTTYRCDAILITREEIQLVQLPRLNTGELERRAQGNDRGSLETLEWLWDVVASPVMDALGLTQHPSGDWPHIWWIPTGILNSFPLHAAGYHRERFAMSVLDRAMSSYSSSVKAIIQGRQRQAKHLSAIKAMVVSMKETPGHEALPFATKEAAELQQWCRTMEVDAITPARQKQDILSQLPSCSIFHFAGHGHTNPNDPSQSSLLLEDWQMGQLTVAALLDVDLRERQPFLAYLSACGTGEIKDDRFVDESLHLVSAFQLAGFRHVIGTLWGVVDELCVDMARITYGEMTKGGMSDGSVCRGLHVASRELRDRWLSQEGLAMRGHFSSKDARERSMEVPKTRSKCVNASGQRKVVVVVDESDLYAPDWVPYIHFGV